jgi:proteasome lid subunit RPN8/RPN11
MLLVPASVLEEARQVFEEAGSHGQEATALLAGEVLGDDQRITRLLVPEQRASTGGGCWVEVTETGKLQIAVTLSPNERWIARIHSHPGPAFHSATDNANPAITAEGSWSIVVPFFGLGLRRGVKACAVHRMEHGRWRLLGAREISSFVAVLP